MEEKKRIPVTVFTAAGASRAEPIALPTMTEFFDEIMDENRHPNSGRISDKAYFKFVFDTLYGNQTDYDLERVMGALYSMSDFMENDSWKIFMHPSLYDNIYSHLGFSSNRAATIEQIKKATLSTYESHKQKALNMVWELEDLIREKYYEIEFEHINAVYMPLFESFLKLRSTHFSPLIPFFTTNYDMSIDWYFDPRDDLDEAGQRAWLNGNMIKMIDGFVNNRWNINNFSTIDERSDTLQVIYHKLHGSLCWEKTGQRVVRNYNYVRDMHINQELMIVYPSDKKILSENPYAYSHKMLDEYLLRTNLLLVIGFSFRDPAIVTAFEYALSFNKELKICVVNPSEEEDFTDEMALFFRKNRGRVVHIKQYFGTNECAKTVEKEMAAAYKPK